MREFLGQEQRKDAHDPGEDAGKERDKDGHDIFYMDASRYGKRYFMFWRCEESAAVLYPALLQS
ncbi:hypothetical protein, partial [Nitrosomonas sp. Nm166]|uniref:hypothetical protein n=1 Tax=Nitrosomonas sp. Nm166 TaxID=1881054 RepID=UPI001C430BBF